jgi:hypothetical protein
MGEGHASYVIRNSLTFTFDGLNIVEEYEYEI